MQNVGGRGEERTDPPLSIHRGTLFMGWGWVWERFWQRFSTSMRRPFPPNSQQGHALKHVSPNPPNAFQNSDLGITRPLIMGGKVDLSFDSCCFPSLFHKSTAAKILLVFGQDPPAFLFWGQAIRRSRQNNSKPLVSTHTKERELFFVTCYLRNLARIPKFWALQFSFFYLWGKESFLLVILRIGQVVYCYLFQKLRTSKRGQSMHFSRAKHNRKTH